MIADLPTLTKKLQRLERRMKDDAVRQESLDRIEHTLDDLLNVAVILIVITLSILIYVYTVQRKEH